MKALGELRKLANALLGTDNDLEGTLGELRLRLSLPEYELRERLRTETDLWQCESCEVWVAANCCDECGRECDPNFTEQSPTNRVMLDRDGCPLFIHQRITASDSLPYLRDVVIAAWEDANVDGLAFVALRQWQEHRHAKTPKRRRFALKARNAFALVCLRALQIIARKSGWDGDDNGDKIDICVETLFDALDTRMPPFDDGIEIYELDDWRDYYAKECPAKYSGRLSWRDIEWVKTLCRRAIDKERRQREYKYQQSEKDPFWDTDVRTPEALGRRYSSRQPWEEAHERDLLDKSYGPQIRKLLDPAFDEFPYDPKRDRESRGAPIWLNRQNWVNAVTDKIDRRIVSLKMSSHDMTGRQIAQVIFGEFGKQISEDTVEARLNKYLRLWETELDPEMKPGRYQRANGKLADLERSA